MNRNYIILTALMIVLAGGLLIIPERQQYQQIDPDELLWEIIQPTRYVSTDKVAQLIIEGDPSLELVDVRPAADYENFSLPKSINIPLDSLLQESYQDYLGIDGMKVLFFSNDDIKADQAWVLAKRLGYDNIYVMKGGLNCWIRTIIQPQEPSTGSPSTEFALYDFRKGAQMYFTGAKVESTDKSSNKKTVKIQRKKKKTTASGGC
jgi:rhodanese-related sulfurtransferase